MINQPTKKVKLPSWPKERDLARYAEFTNIDFKNDLSGAKIWIDIGCRTGKALSQSQRFHQAELIGSNAHPIKVRKGIKAIFARLPEDTILFEKYQRQADLLTDIHGAVSYAENPLEALIYLSCLLKPNAKAVAVTLEARFGSTKTWDRISSFFKLKMKQEISFERFCSYSDNTKTPIKTLRITIMSHSSATPKLQDLFAAARADIGAMKKTKVIAQAPDKSFTIWRVLFKLP